MGDHMKPFEKIPDKILFYDLETTDQFAPYCDITKIVVGYGFDNPPKVVRTEREKRIFAARLRSPVWWKVGFNNLNFDDIVLARHGIVVNEKNRHDCYLMAKSLSVLLPSYSMKFLNFYFLSDPHFPEMELETWMARTGKSWDEVPKEILEPYALHDIVQTRNLFKLFYSHIQQSPDRTRSYLADMKMGKVLEEIILKGRMYVDKNKCLQSLQELQKRRDQLELDAEILSKGLVNNPNSSKQLGAYLDAEGFALKLTETGDFQVDKKVLEDLKDKNPVARIAHEVRFINGLVKYYEAYLRAIEDSKDNSLPRQYSISNARTRRFTSSSKYKINFQNASKDAKKVQIVPKGWLGVYIDSTQIENVVHIYESEDTERRKAYEADPNWSEYVWLCNRILGTNKTKEELDSIQSPQNRMWSVYKQYKTAKLALNFGMGVKSFCSLLGFSLQAGNEIFADIHRACPAIRNLQNRVEWELKQFGYVTDPFGYIYQGPANKAYKVVAYLIQGCGTGSLPKAMLRANYETLRKFDCYLKGKNREVGAGHTCGNIHDENEYRLNLNLDRELLLQCLQELMFNMTKRFSSKFDGIPLRAKLYLSRTTAAEAEEVDINNTKEILKWLI